MPRPPQLLIMVSRRLKSHTLIRTRNHKHSTRLRVFRSSKFERDDHDYTHGLFGGGSGQGQVGYFLHFGWSGQTTKAISAPARFPSISREVAQTSGLAAAETFSPDCHSSPPPTFLASSDMLVLRRSATFTKPSPDASVNFRAIETSPQLLTPEISPDPEE
jgi:hypothetical protein